MYSEKVLDHFHHPRHVGEIADATTVIEATNPVCGDVLKLWVLLRDGCVADVKFKVEGCIPAIACASWLAESMMGKPLAELRSLTPGEIEAGLGGLPSASRHASALAVAGLKRLLEESQ
jgi:nitrogen fixation protein NifU and related proteins